MKKLDIQEPDWYDYFYTYKKKRYHYRVSYVPKVYPDSITYWLGDIPNNIRRKVVLRSKRKAKELKIRNSVKYPNMTEYEIDCYKWSRNYDIQQYTYLATEILIVLGATVFVFIKHDAILDWLFNILIFALDRLVN